jgi:16S rRNA (guanine527-N7)-methyltransferase
MARSSPGTVLDQFNVSRESLRRLETYVSRLLKWQQRVNLIGASTVEQVWERHIGDALQLLPLMRPDVQNIADLGSGAGIPGLVVAIATGAHVHLYESNGKKAAFLREAVRHTGASATIHQLRIENLRDNPPLPMVEFVLARALAPLVRLLDYATPFMEAGAIGLFHKGHGVETELAAARQGWNLLYTRHPSMIDSHGVILEVKEARRVQT